MDINKEDLQLIDFYKCEGRYNQFALYFGKKDNKKYWGDDWNDTPYEHNAGEVYQDYVEETEHIMLHNSIALQPCDIPELNSGWCKQDFQKRLTPCLLIVPFEVLREDYEIYPPDYDEFPSYTKFVKHSR